MWPFKRREAIAAPVPVVPVILQQEAPRRPWWASFGVRAWAKTDKQTVIGLDEAFKIYEPAPGVLPRGAPTAKQMAMDNGLDAVYGFSADFGYYAGCRFLGYPYLAQLAQETEYRRPAEIIADHMTRRWITLTSTSKKDNTEKLKRIEAAMKALGVQDAFRQVALQGEFFGRSQIYIDTGYTDDNAELKLPLFLDPRKIKKGGKKGSLRGIRVIEPYWSYPNQYNSTNPLKPDFYRPQTWFVMSQEVHHTRLLTFVPHEVPDILKPMYAFGGLSLTQMLMVDVNNWIRTRQSVSDVTHNFAVSGIKSDLSTMLQSDGLAGLQDRAQFISDVKDNQGLLLLDNATEEFFTTATPLSSLDLLQAQAQEHMAAPAGIPLIIRFGITPSGLNATSDGELQVWADWIQAQQEHRFTPHLSTIIKLVQLSEFGEIDPDIGFKYESLQRKDMLDLATIQKVQADTDAVNIGSGVISTEEAREAQAADEDGRYSAIDLAGPAPEPVVDPANDPPDAGDPESDSGDDGDE